MIRLDYINYLYDIGFALISIDVIWILILEVLRTSLGISPNSKRFNFPLKGLILFIYSSLIAIITYNYISQITIFLYDLGYCITAFLSLYFYVLSKMHRNKIRAAGKMDMRLIKRLRYDSYFLLASVLFLAFAIAFPNLTKTYLASLVIEFLYWIDNFLLIRVIFGCIGMLAMVQIMIKGGYMTINFIRHFLEIIGVKKIKKKYFHPDVFKKEHTEGVKMIEVEHEE